MKQQTCRPVPAMRGAPMAYFQEAVSRRCVEVQCDV